jgi:hypothetical protein
VRGVGVGVVREYLDERKTIFKGNKRISKNFGFNQIGGLDKSSKMIEIG